MEQTSAPPQLEMSRRYSTLNFTDWRTLPSCRTSQRQSPAASSPSFFELCVRHGDNGTVDVADHGFSADDFTYAHGPNLRFVADLTPDGPKARNALPGGNAVWAPVKTR